MTVVVSPLHGPELPSIGELESDPAGTGDLMGKPVAERSLPVTVNRSVTVLVCWMVMLDVLLATAVPVPLRVEVPFPNP